LANYCFGIKLFSFLSLALCRAGQSKAIYIVLPKIGYFTTLTLESVFKMIQVCFVSVIYSVSLTFRWKLLDNNNYLVNNSRNLKMYIIVEQCSRLYIEDLS
jgi:hypothetical protein